MTTTTTDYPEIISIKKNNTAIILKDTGKGHLLLIQAIRNGEENLQYVTQCSLMQAGVFVQHFISDLIFLIQQRNEYQIGIWESWVDEKKIPEHVKREWVDVQDEYFKALNARIISELENQ